MKITQSDQNITPFGGFNFCCKFFHKTGISTFTSIPNLIDNHLGKRVKLFGFDYSDIFTTHMAIYLWGRLHRGCQ